MFKWGIIGAGQISSQFAKGIEYFNSNESEHSMEVYAVASKSRMNSGGIQAKKFYQSYEELAADPEVDAIYIGTINTQHLPCARLCLAAGKPVLCEKPVTIHQGQLQELLSLAEQNQTFFMEAMWSRMIPANQYLRQMIQEKRFGNVQHISLSFGNKVPCENSRIFDVKQGGGALLDIGIYGINLAEYWMDAKAKEFHGWSEKTADTVDLYTSVQLSYENGAKADMTFAVDRKLSNAAYLILDEAEIYVPYFWRPEQLCIYEPNGNFINNRLRETKEFPLVGNGYSYEAEEVMHCVKNGELESPVMSWEESMHMMKMLDAVRNLCGICYPEDEP